MLRIHFRGFISILLSLAFLVAASTGIVLWLSHAPETFGIGKGVWKHCHIFVSLLMLLAGVLHLWLNWPVYWGYLWQRSAGRLNQKRELVLALTVIVAVICVASYGGHGDKGRLFGMSLQTIAEKSGKPVDQMVMDVPISLRSRSDFLRMLRQLGAKPGVNYCRFDPETRDICDIQHVYLRCRYDQWVQAFGEPEAVSPGFDSADGATVRIWQHQCVDGPATCIGHLFEHPSEVRWVVVARVCFS